MRERNLVGFTPTKNVQFRCPIKEFRSNVISLALSEPSYVILLWGVEWIKCCFWSLQNNTVGPPSQQTTNTGLKSKRENGKKTVRYRGIKQIQTVHFIFEIMNIRKYHILLFNKLSLCPYMVRKPSISVIRTWQISRDIRKWPYLEVHCRFSFIACLAAILKSEGLLAVFSGNFNSLEETFHD